MYWGASVASRVASDPSCAAPSPPVRSVCLYCRPSGRRQPPHMRGGARGTRTHHAQDLASIIGEIYRTWSWRSSPKSVASAVASSPSKIPGPRFASALRSGGVLVASTILKVSLKGSFAPSQSSFEHLIGAADASSGCRHALIHARIARSSRGREAAVVRPSGGYLAGIGRSLRSEHDQVGTAESRLDRLIRLIFAPGVRTHAIQR